jgi:predicted lipoprotein with Yx(FWY)xxD motif
MTRRPIAALVAASACAAVLLAACSTGSGSSPSPTGGGASITVASSSAGDHLAGPNGRALYVFAHDSANTSTCTDTCATNWPPVTVSAGQQPVAGSGVTTQLGTLTRSDGTLQVTANGLPLYYYGGDSAASDIKGQGVLGIWFLAGVDGKALGGAAGSPASSGSSPSASPAPASSGYY